MARNLRLGVVVEASAGDFIGAMAAAGQAVQRLHSQAARLTRGMTEAATATRQLRTRSERLTAGLSRSAQATQRQISASARLAFGMRRAGNAAREQAASIARSTAAAQNNTGTMSAMLGRTLGYTAAAGALVYAAGRLTGALVRQADAYTELNNRLRLVTNSEAALVAVRGRLLDLSQATRSALDANAQLYSRIALSAETTGHSQAQLLRVTELLNMQVAIGGNNATEAAAGLVQFAQGLASGRLQGDELRSVMENLLGVQQGLIEGFRILRQRGQIDFNVTRANIRDLAAEGVLSSRLLLDAVLASADDTEQKFRDVEITVSGATQQMGNAFLALFGRIDEVTGASDALAESLSGVANEIASIAEGPTLYDLVSGSFSSQSLSAFTGSLFGGVDPARLLDVREDLRQDLIAEFRAATPAGNRVEGHAPVWRTGPVRRAGLTAPSAFSVLAGVAPPHEPSRRQAAAAFARTRIRRRESDRLAAEEAPRLDQAGRGELDFLLSDAERIDQKFDARIDRVRAHGAELQRLGRTRAEALLQIEMDRERAHTDLARRQHAERIEQIGLHEIDVTATLREAITRRKQIEREAAQRRREREVAEYAERLARAQGFGDARIAQEAQQEEQLLQQKYRYNQQLGNIAGLSARAARQQGLAQTKTLLEIGKQGFGALAAQSKKAFKIQKALAITQTIISTYQAAQDSYKALAAIPVVGPALGIAAAAAAIAAGLGRVAAIRAQQPQAFARGGVVDRPTFFSAPGVPAGVAGEAGPEAILPLRRGSDGRLGVAAAGGPGNVTVNTELNVYAQGEMDDDFIERLSRRLERTQTQAMLRLMRDQQRSGGLLNRTEAVG